MLLLIVSLSFLSARQLFSLCPINFPLSKSLDPKNIIVVMAIVPPFSADLTFLNRCLIKPLSALVTHGDRLPVDYVALCVFVSLFVCLSVSLLCVFLCLHVSLSVSVYVSVCWSYRLFVCLFAVFLFAYCIPGILYLGISVLICYHVRDGQG